MERDWLLTIFVSAGQSRKLGKRSEAVEAVSQGLLTADSRVMVRLPSGERLQRRAIELDHLVDLFPTAKPENVALEPMVEPVQEPESAPQPEIEPVLEPGPGLENEAAPEPASVPESETALEPSPEEAQVAETDSLPISAPVSEIEPEVEPVLQQQADEEPLPELIPEPEQEPRPNPTLVLEREVVAEPQPEPEAAVESETQALSEPDGILATDVGTLPLADDDWDYQPPPAAKSRNLALKVAVLGILLALIAAGAFMWFRGNEEGGKRYLLSDVSGFEAPKPNAKSGDRLSYGQAVMVEPSEEDSWLRVVEGSYQGLYLPGTLLSRDPPPEIDRTASGMIAAQNRMELRIAPDETTEVVGSIPAGSSRFAQGIVHDRDGRAWFVFLIDEDSLPRAAFGQRDGAHLPEQATVAPIPTATSESPVPVESVPAQATSSARMDSCAGIRRKLDRFMCQDPGLRGSEAEFSSAYARAAARFGQAGQTLQPMTRFAARIEQCGSPQCAGARYREQTALLESLQPAARAIPVPIVREAARNATPRGNPGSWIRSDDYPARAMKAGEEGTVRFNLTISPNGAVTACQIVGTSGSSALDEVTCRLVSRRARFNPAIDSAGTAIEGRYANTVRWRLPE